MLFSQVFKINCTYQIKGNFALSIFTSFFISRLSFVTENYNHSLSDAKIATDLQACYVKAIERGEFFVT